MVFIAWGILNDTKQYGHFGYVHAKNKEKALKRARILFWKKGYVAGVSPLWQTPGSSWYGIMPFALSWPHSGCSSLTVLGMV